jgi:hypothetical protein
VTDLNAPGGRRVPPGRPRQYVLEEAGGEVAAVVRPYLVIFLLRIEMAALFVEVGLFAPLNFILSPAFGGTPILCGVRVSVLATSRCQIERPQAKPKRQRTQKRARRKCEYAITRLWHDFPPSKTLPDC